MKTIWGAFIVIMLMVTVFYSMSIVGTEAYNNANLDNNSKTLILSINDQLDDNFNYTNDFDPTTTNLTNGSANFDSEDVFAQQYLEGKRDATENIGIISTLWKMPDMIIISLGVPAQAVNVFKGILYTIIGVIITLITFRTIFGSGRVD